MAFFFLSPTLILPCLFGTGQFRFVPHTWPLWLLLCMECTRSIADLPAEGILGHCLVNARTVQVWSCPHHLVTKTKANSGRSGSNIPIVCNTWNSLLNLNFLPERSLLFFSCLVFFPFFFLFFWSAYLHRMKISCEDLSFVVFLCHCCVTHKADLTFSLFSHCLFLHKAGDALVLLKTRFYYVSLTLKYLNSWISKNVSSLKC